MTTAETSMLKNTLHQSPTLAKPIRAAAAVETVGGADVVTVATEPELLLAAVPDPGSTLALDGETEVTAGGSVLDTGPTLVAGSGGVAAAERGVVSG